MQDSWVQQTYCTLSSEFSSGKSTVSKVNYCTSFFAAPKACEIASDTRAFLNTKLQVMCSTTVALQLVTGQFHVVVYHR